MTLNALDSDFLGSLNLGFEECVVTTGLSGTQVRIRGSAAGPSDVDDIGGRLNVPMNDCFYFSSTPPQDPLLPGAAFLDPLSSQTSITSAQVRKYFADSQQPLEQMTTSQISNALANSQDLAPFSTEPSFLTWVADNFPTGEFTAPAITTERSDSVRNFSAMMTANPVYYMTNDPFHGQAFDVVDSGTRGMSTRSSMKTPVAAPDPTLVNRLGDSKVEPGEYGFRIGFPNVKGGGKEWLFDDEKQLLFVKIATWFEVDFSWKKVPPSGSLIRARAVFEDKTKINDPVGVCVAHKVDNNTAFLFTNDEKAKPKPTTAEIIIPLAPPKNKKNGWERQIRFGTRCWNSCFKSKTQIGIIFELVVGSNVVGKAHINVRCCACPDRDSKIYPKSEGKAKHVKGTKKRELEVEVKKEPGSPGVDGPSKRRASAGPVSGAVASIPTSTAATHSSGAFSGGIEQSYGQNKDGTLWLKQNVCVSPDLKIFVDQLVATGNTVDWCHKMKANGVAPSSPFVQPAGRYPMPAPTKSDELHGMQTRNAMEIRRWLRLVCHTNLISEDVFLDAGRTSLSDVFKLTYEELNTILGGELMPEAVAKFWLKVEEKERPQPAAASTSSDSQSRSGSGPLVGDGPYKKRVV